MFRPMINNLKLSFMPFSHLSSILLLALFWHATIIRAQEPVLSNTESPNLEPVPCLTEETTSKSSINF